MRVVGIVQARMTSTRLPGKVLMEVLGKPLLQYELERLKKIPSLDELVVATTVNGTDDPVVELCDKLGVPVFRGSELDVLSRYCEAAEQYRAEAVVRFTADCPLIDPEISDSVIRYYLEHERDVDYCSTDMSTYPRGGVETEICLLEVLREADREGTTTPDREHVTHFICSRPERYKQWRKQSGNDWSKYRFTVDTPEDFKLVSEIIKRIYPQNANFTISEVISLLENNPELPMINEMIEQKTS